MNIKITHMDLDFFDKDVLREHWLNEHGYIDSHGESDAFALDLGMDRFEKWYKSTKRIFAATAKEMENGQDHHNA